MTMNNQRDFNKENKDNLERKYAYHFDYDVIHPLIMRSFKPFLRMEMFLNWEVSKVNLQFICGNVSRI